MTVTTATGRAATPSRLRIALILGALIALGPLTIDTYLPALPAVGADLATSEPTVQLTLTGTLIGLAIGQVLIGPLSDALGRRRPLIAGAALHVAVLGRCRDRAEHRGPGRPAGAAGRGRVGGRRGRARDRA